MVLRSDPMNRRLARLIFLVLALSACLRLAGAEGGEEKLLANRAARLSLLPPPPKPPSVSGPVNNAIDRFIAARWKTKSFPTPALCDDAVFLRRVYLDVTGLPPTAAAVRAFEADRAKDKRVRAIDELLGRREEYAAHWTPFWEDALGSASADYAGGIPTRGNHRTWIHDSFAANKPFDVFVAELIDPAMPGYQRPSTNDANGKKIISAYIRHGTPEETRQTAAEIGQVFLGTGLKCASCHSHFLNKEWPQSRFLAFAGLFGAEDLELVRCEKKSGTFVPAKFPFELPGVSADIPADLPARLHRATQWLVDPTNPRFARTVVNRLWKRYLGLGLFEPVDDFRLDQKPSHPELLDWLADDFVRHGYDIKHTARLILTSRTYQLRYDPAVEDHFDLARPADPRYFRSPQLRRLTAEQFIDSVRFVANRWLDPRRRVYLNRTSTQLTRALSKPASRSALTTVRSDDTAVVQLLELLNGSDLQEFVYPGDLCDELAQKTDLGQVANELFMSALSRPPSTAESLTAETFLKANWVQPGAESSKEVIVLDEELGAGDTVDAGWKWVTAPEPVLSGQRAHTSAAGKLSHTLRLKSALEIGARDILFTYIYLDPAHPPEQIFMKWKQGRDWENRGVWPTAQIPKGRWLALEMPVREVGLKPSEPIIEWSFEHTEGVVYWDRSGLRKLSRLPAISAIGDTLWALFVSPEFQYIH